MDAKEYLERYAELKRVHKRNLAECKAEAYLIKQLQETPAPSTLDAHQVQAAIKHTKNTLEKSKAADLEAKKVAAIVESVPDIEGKILRLRYIECLTWEQICESVFASWPCVRIHHQRGLEKIQSIIDSNEYQVES